MNSVHHKGCKCRLPADGEAVPETGARAFSEQAESTEAEVRTRQETYPPPLMTSEPGSFARQTIVERKPQILCEVNRAYPYPPEIQAGLRAFAAEIASLPIRPLHEDASDVDLWNGAWATFRLPFAPCARSRAS